MTRPHDDERRVEQFFAAHRASVQEEPADELTWRRIVEQHRTRARGSRRAALAGTGVAAAALAVGAYAVWPMLAPQTGPAGPGDAATTVQREEDRDGVTTEAPEASVHTGPVTGGPAVPTGPVTAGPAPEAIPDDLQLRSLDRAGSGVRGVGSHECADGARCVLLVGADETGAWAPVADLTALALPRPGQDGAGLDVTFADAATGYAFGGGGLWVTTDGGATWRSVDTSGRLVHDVEVAGEEVVAALSDGACTEEGCPGAALASGPVGAPTLQDWGSAITGTGLLTAVDLQPAGDELFVAVRGTGGGVEAWRLQRGRAESLADPAECEGDPLAFAAAPDVEGHLALACRVAGSGGEPRADVAVTTSALGGRTWSGLGGALAVVEPEVRLAMTDADHLLVLTPDEVLTSRDGGRSWQVPAVPQPVTASAVLELVAEPGGVVHAVTDDALTGHAPGYWSSADHGQTWERVDLLP